MPDRNRIIVADVMMNRQEAVALEEQVISQGFIPHGHTGIWEGSAERHLAHDLSTDKIGAPEVAGIVIATGGLWKAARDEERQKAEDLDVEPVSSIDQPKYDKMLAKAEQLAGLAGMNDIPVIYIDCYAQVQDEGDKPSLDHLTETTLSQWLDGIEITPFEVPPESDDLFRGMREAG